MCGIAGIWEPSGDERLEDRIRSMTSRLAHRGPDAGGTQLHNLRDTTLAIGHRRLSILDLSPAGSQPMSSPCGRWTLTYNGEVYNHAELRRELAGRGATFRGHSDTEVLLAGIATWGFRETLERANGMGDSDQVHLALENFAEDTGAEINLTTGSNAAINLASIDTYGIDSEVRVGGDVYSEALLYQADLIDTDADPLGVALPALANEAVAFLADNMIGPEIEVTCTRLSQQEITMARGR